MTNLSIKLCQAATVVGPLIVTAAAPVVKVLAVALSSLAGMRGRNRWGTSFQRPLKVFGPISL